MINSIVYNPSLFTAIAGLFGLVCGSFLNVVIYRMPIMLKKFWRAECELLLNPQKTPPPQKTPVFNLSCPRSHCPDCNHMIPIWHNIPLISFIILRGQCAFCKAKISWQYPLVELLCAILFAFAFLQFSISLKCFFVLIFMSFLICMSMIDIKHQLLPDELTLGLLWVGLVASTTHTFVYTADAIMGAALGYLFLWGVVKVYYLFTKKIGMGHGDFKLLAALGAWFGMQWLPIILLLASVLGAIAGIIYLKSTRQNKSTPIPFGPFLCFSGFIVMFWGSTIGHFAF